LREDWGGWVSKYYRLKDKYKLRGWELLPYALMDSEMRRTHFVQKAEFDALTLCDGTVDLALPPDFPSHLGQCGKAGGAGCRAESGGSGQGCRRRDQASV